MKKKTTQIFGTILIIISVLFLFFNSKFVQSHLINKSQHSIVKKADAETMKKANSKDGNFNPNTTSLATQRTVLKNAIKAKKINPIGIMSIPDVKMQNPILKGYGDNGSYLALGACTTQKNEIMGQGNYSLAGHYMNSDTVFHSLANVKIGSKIYVTDNDKIFIYQVISNETINKTDTYVLNTTNSPTITLITCKGINETPWRTCVKGKLIQILPASKENIIKYDLNY